MSQVPSYAKPLPEITSENRAFWDGLRAGKLQLQRCNGCGHIRYPISIICPECLSPDHEWTPLSGNGAIFSYIVFHQVYNKAYADDVPYNVALIQLDEGPRMFSNIVAPGPGTGVGDRVHVVFDPVTEDVTLPKFAIDEPRSESS